MKILIIANWKCNPSSLICAKKLFSDIKKGLQEKQNTEIIICPPFTYIHDLSVMAGKKIKIGAQNVFWEEGTHTGEVSAKMLKNMGCKYAIIGHSERRAMGETNELVNKKIKACLAQKIIPIFCIGESSQEKEAEETFQVLQTQIQEGLEGISRNQVEKIIIAYEPLWAIGTGKNCAYDEAMSINLVIKKTLAKTYNKGLSKKIKIIYGGSINFSIIEGYIKESMMDGVLVGGASLKAKEFIAILNKF
jgi:triosephosphate isomerase